MASNYKVMFEENKDIIKAIGKQTVSSKEIIDVSLPTFLSCNAKSKTLVSILPVRLGLQGQFNGKQNGIRYSNLQIQLNKQKLDTQGEAEKEKVKEAEGTYEKRKSTTIALVLMPCDEKIPETIMKQAFNDSLDNREKATIFKIA